MEQAQLKTKMEQMELELSLIKSDAKVRVLENWKSGSQNPPLFLPQSQGDGMNEYLKEYHRKSYPSVVSSIQFTGLGNIPSTRLLNPEPKPPE